MEHAETKSCPLCCETIASSARKCPHCLHYQGKLSTILIHPALGVLIGSIPLLALMSLFYWMLSNQFSINEKYSDHLNALTVLDSKISFGERWCDGKSHETIVVLGTIENSSNITWENVHLEVAFFNAEGDMVDAEQEHKYSFVVPARDKAIFSVDFDLAFPKDQYKSHAVRVLSASEKTYGPFD